MISGRYTDKDIKVDVLRMILNRSLILPLVILICGHPQIGKSTFLFYLANRIEQIKKKIPLRKATWREWDYRKHCTITPQQFVSLSDTTEGCVNVMEEAGEQMNYLEWWGAMSQVFDSDYRTQGYKKNINILITPKSGDIVKHNKEHLDFKLWVTKRNDEKRFAKVKSRYIKIDYLKDKTKMGFILDWNIYYSPKFIREATKYTDWLKVYKRKIAEENKRKVGIGTNRKESFNELCLKFGVVPPSEATRKRYGIKG